MTTLVLAGGAARRLPGKLAREFDDEPLLARVVRRVASDERALAIATNARDLAEVRTIVTRVAPHATYLLDAETHAGPLVALASATRALASATHAPLDRTPATDAWLAVVAGDMPFVDAAFLDALAAHAAPNVDAVVPTDPDGRRHPLAACYRLERVAAVTHALVTRGERRLGALLDALGDAVREIAIDDDTALTNCNTAAEFTEAHDTFTRHGTGAT